MEAQEPSQMLFLLLSPVCGISSEQQPSLGAACTCLAQNHGLNVLCGCRKALPESKCLY